MICRRACGRAIPTACPAAVEGDMPSWVDASIFGITLFVMLIGLFGTLIPMFPGIVVIWLAALGYGVVVGFNWLGWVIFTVITLLMIAGVVVDNVLMGLGAKKGGASWKTIAAATVTGVLGTLLFPPIGGLIAAPVTVFAIEFYRVKDWRKARGAFGGLALGWGLSFAAKFGIGMVMVLFWGIWAVYR
jgi:uncharacterized protein